MHLAALALLAAAAERAVPTPTGSPAEWVSNDDYPAEALAKNEQGTVSFALDVDATGVVTACWVTLSSGSPALDAATCQALTQRARFKPARDERGRVTAGQYRSRITWQIPREPMPLESWSVTARALIDEKGEILSCETDKQGKWPADSDACEFLRRMPAGMGLVMRGTAVPGRAELMFQFGMALDGTEPPATYREAGRTVTNLLLVAFEIDRDGKMQNCRFVQRQGVLGATATDCQPPFGQFDTDQPGPAREFPIKATFLWAYSTKPAAP